MQFARGAIGWGVVMYALMYLLWSGLLAYGLAEGYASLAIRLLLLTSLAWIGVQSLHFVHWYDLAPYAFTWALVAGLLDAVLLLPFSGVALYASYTLWLGYALIVLIPMVLHAVFQKLRT